MSRSKTLETCRKYLYSDIDEIPDTYRQRVMRVRVGFTFWYEFPTKTRTEVRDTITNEFNVASRTAYEDIQIIEVLLGNIQNPAKAWMRYRINSMLEEAYSKAELDNDVKGMVYAADKLGKYNQLDMPDAEPIPFDQIIPQSFEATEDPTPLGIKRDPNYRDKKRKMLEKYASETQAIDVPYEEIVQDDNYDEQEKDLL